MSAKLRKRTTILVADDDQSMLGVTAAILNRQGYNVLIAQDGETALKVFAEASDTVQLVISDVDMPRMLGTQLVRSIMALSPSTATLLVSGAIESAKAAGFPALAKPFHSETLVAKVENLLAACDFAQIEREQLVAKSSPPPHRRDE